MKKVAIYSRKSKYTGKGDSIENQIEMCKNYVLRTLTDVEFLIYEDEGYSGGNLDRPEFKRLMEDIKTGNIDYLVCYRLDRISRNVADFSGTLEILQENHCNFISIKEQFDTTTPMGRAMIYIASVFAQLERETIAERVKDNMFEMAKNGYWTGGKIPLGFISKEVEKLDTEGNKRIKHTLVINEKESNFVKLLYEKYLELKSLHKLEVYVTKNNLRSRNGILLEKSSLKIILQNPVYVKANEDVLDYLQNNNWTVYGDIDNIHSLLTYNKTEQSKRNGKYVKVKKDESERFAAVSNIKGFIEPDLWLNVQRQFDNNKDLFPRLGKTHNALLLGKIKCGYCNSYMLIQHGRTDVNGNKLFYYVCSLKRKSHKANCDNNNAKASEVENLVIEALKQLGLNKKRFIDNLKKSISSKSSSKNYKTEKNLLQNSYEECKLKIDKLVDILSTTDDSDTVPIILAKIKKLKQESKNIEFKIDDLENDYQKSKISKINLEIIEQYIDMCSKIDTLERDKQKEIIDKLIDTIYWFGDGKRSGKVKIKFIGSDDDSQELHFSSPSTCKVVETATFKKVFETIEKTKDYSTLPETTLQEKVYKLRVMHNLTQKEFAMITSVSYSCICKYEIGYNANKTNLKKICDAFNIAYDYFDI